MDQTSKLTTTKRPPIVAFDFDGTLTDRDSFNAFLRWRCSPTLYALRMASLAPSVAAYLWRRDRGALKAAAVRVFLAKVGPSALTAAAEAFCASHFDALMRPDALRGWERAGRQGAERVIVTASPELLVAPFARRLRADRVLGTRLALSAEGVLRLEGANCRGLEKVRRLREIYGPDVQLAEAYGDTSGDREMLALALRPGLKVFRERAPRSVRS